MPERPAQVLVVDDSPVNRKLLDRLLHVEGYAVTTAADGREAMDRLRDADAGAIDVILLDILMPEMDGYEVLQLLRDDERLHHVPVIVISAIEDVDSVIRCIEAGATDYLQKPFNAAILRARVASSLAEKRLRDTELEYLREVGRITDAALALEDGTLDSSTLAPVAERGDALGNLARVFGAMAVEVQAREHRLRRQVDELRMEVDEARRQAQVEEITGSDYFRELRTEATSLRQLLREDGATSTGD